MSTYRTAGRWQIYPAKYFGASPTWNIWCKLSVADVHGLREEPGFEGQNVLFHLNHPIRYVYIVAQIVGITDRSKYFTLITIDDASGATIDLKVKRSKDLDKPLETDVQNMTIHSRVGGEFTVRVNEKIVDVGTLVKVKGLFSSFKGERQIDPKRIWIVNDTAEEMAAWMDIAKFKQDTLLRPWRLSDKRRAVVDEHLVQAETLRKEEARRNKHKEQSRAQRLAEKEQRRLKYEQHAERKRLALEREMNQGALI